MKSRSSGAGRALPLVVCANGSSFEDIPKACTNRSIISRMRFARVVPSCAG